MNMHSWFSRIALVLIIHLQGCGTMGIEQTGRFIGAAVHSVVGRPSNSCGDRVQNKPCGAVGGDVAGRQGVIKLEQEDSENLAAVLDVGRSGSIREWTNLETGRHFAVTPFETELDESGRICREFVVERSEAGGNLLQSDSIACRDGAGDWEVSV